MWLCFWIAILALALPVPAWAAGPQDVNSPDRFVFGENFILESGDTLNEDLFLFGGNATLESGSKVNGDVVIAGGNLNANGEINGTIMVLGGRVSLGKMALVSDDVLVMGGYLDKHPDAQVEGDVNTQMQNNLGIDIPGQIFVPSSRAAFPDFGDAMWWLWLPFVTFVMATLAIVAVSFWPKQVARTARAAVVQPWAAGGMGLLTLVVAVPVTILLIVTILLSPVAIIGLGVLAALILFGWISLGLEVGQRLAQAFKQDWHPAASAGVGAFALTFVAVGIERVVWCIGWVAPFTLTVLALGAALLTLFGTRDYPGLAVRPTPPAAPLAAAPEDSPTTP
jgi:hypothetical protein